MTPIAIPTQASPNNSFRRVPCQPTIAFQFPHVREMTAEERAAQARLVRRAVIVAPVALKA